MASAPNSSVLLFGGNSADPYDGAERDTNQSWMLFGGAWHNVTNPANGPSPRTGATLDFDPNFGGFILWGGCIVTVCLADTWEYANGHWDDLTPSLGAGPPGVAGGEMIFDPNATENATVLLLGDAGTSETWTLVPTAWSELSSAPPSARLAGAMSYDAATGEALLFGGLGTCGSIPCDLSDTWLFGGGGWSDISASSCAVACPGGRQHAAVAFLDGPTPGVVVYGGWIDAGPGTWGDTWLFTGGRWTSIVTPDQPTYLSSAGSASYGTGEAAVVFGGIYTTNGVSQETWTLENQVSVLLHVPVTTTDVGVPLTFPVNETGGVAPLSYSWNFGDGSTTTSTSPVHPFDRSGSFAVVLFVTDVFGSWNDDGALIQVNERPGARVQANPTACDVGENVTFSAVVTNGTAPFAYLWHFGDGVPGYGPTVHHAYATAESFPVVVMVIDSQNVSVTSSALAYPVAPLPTVTGLNESASVTDVGVPVVFTGSWAGGTPPVHPIWTSTGLAQCAEQGSRFTCTYSGTGVVEVSLRTYDARESDSATWNVSVVVNPRPTVTLSPSGATIAVGISLALNASIADGTPPYSLAWFVNGVENTAWTNATPSFVESTPGVYNISAHVADAAGGSSVSDNLSVTVHENPQGPPHDEPGPGISLGDSSLPLWEILLPVVAGAAAVVAAFFAVRRRRRAP